jgi:hypothetical protein
MLTKINYFEHDTFISASISFGKNLRKFYFAKNLRKYYFAKIWLIISDALLAVTRA